MTMSKEEKLNSPCAERTVTFSDHCRILLEELMVFIIFFSVITLIMLSFFTLLAGMGSHKHLRSTSCSWPPEWCSFLYEDPNTQRPFSILERTEGKRTVPKYKQFLDYMFRSQ